MTLVVAEVTVGSGWTGGLMVDSDARAHVWVSGRVQGVYFRSAARDAARELGVSGWVRNLPDSRVEAVFEGAASAVDAAVEWCRHGPPAAEVISVDVVREDPEGIEGFAIR